MTELKYTGDDINIAFEKSIEARNTSALFVVKLQLRIEMESRVGAKAIIDTFLSRVPKTSKVNVACITWITRFAMIVILK